MSRLVTLPETNMALAIVAIDNVGPQVTGISLPDTVDHNGRHRFNYTALLKRTRSKIVDEFMAQYPRGKGTKGNVTLRRFYAAAYHWKRAHSAKQYSFLSRDRDHMALCHAKALPKTLRNLFISLPEDGSVILDPKGSTKHWMTLCEKGLVSGLFHGDDKGRPASVWLTDSGMTAQKWAKKQDRAEALLKMTQKATDRMDRIELLLDYMDQHNPTSSIDNMDEFIGFVREEAKALIACR